MANLAYYSNERKVFSVAFEKKLLSDEAKIVFFKLSRHYKISPALEWTSGRNNPKAWGIWKVRLNYEWLNFGVICHELGHTLANKKFGRIGHCKKHWNIMKRMIAYCEKKNWFAEEIARRTAPKPIVIVNPDEVRQMELIKTQEKIIRYEKKIVFYQKKLTKAKRSYIMKNKWIQKQVNKFEILEKSNDEK